MSLGNLEILKQYRQELLLAEVAALLHDVGKFCNLHIEAHAKGGARKWANDHAYKAIVDNPAAHIRLSRKAGSLKKPDALKNILNAGNPKAADFFDNSLKDFLANHSLAIFGENYTLAELIMLGTPGFAVSQNRAELLDGKPGWLAAVLGVCHSEAHVDKQDPAKGEGEQIWPDVFISNAFGFEREKVVVDASPKSLDARLRALQVHSGRKALLNELAYGLGDTRQPVNEVLLSDWGWIVATFFKSALAGALVKNQQFSIRQGTKDKLIDHDLRWRLLRVNFDVLSLYAKSVKIADLLAYREAVDQACERVKQLVEEEYPLGNEVYRDSTGIYFAFPDLDLPAELEQEIRRRVEAIEPELAPYIAVTPGDGQTAQEQLKGILGKARREAQEVLKQPFAARNLSPRWQQEWETVGAGKWEVCPVCRLRPKEEGGEVCFHCEKRRNSRLQTWKHAPAQTIWLTETADHNDRVALLVGKFGLDDWLSGDLVQTMLVKAAEGNLAGCTPKNPSPARLRRVWETCERFWNETVQGILDNHPYGEQTKDSHLRRLRYRLTPDRLNGWRENFAYNGTVEGKDITLLWRQESGDFLTINNLQIAGEIKAGQTVRVSMTDTPPRRYVEFTVKDVGPVGDEFAHYRPYLTLPASPDQFLAFVPAADALTIAQNISAAYREHFGKVRNRLSLSLGLVFFPRKMPLMAVMDAARQMLPMPVNSEPVNSEPWTVSSVDGNGQIEFENGLTWRVPTVMGDAKTEDWWYPYFELDGAPAAHHTHRFEQNGKTWVHVKNLQPKDRVCVTPSTFDFEYLDTAARRFEVHYDENGRRPRRTRPFYLEDLGRFETLWGEMRRLTRTQLKQILQTIETTRERWFGRDEQGKSADDETFRQFVKDTLATAAWPKDHLWKDNPHREKLIEAARRGVFTDLAELHLEILKEGLQEEQSQGGTR